MLDAGGIDILPVQPDDGEAEDELAEAQEGGDDEADEAAVRGFGAVTQAHLGDCGVSTMPRL